MSNFDLTDPRYKGGWKVCIKCKVLFLVDRENKRIGDHRYCFAAAKKSGLTEGEYPHVSRKNGIKYAAWNVTSPDVTHDGPQLLTGFLFCTACGCLYYAVSDNQNCAAERNSKHTPGLLKYALHLYKPRHAEENEQTAPR
jgi:hypothetical protein